MAQQHINVGTSANDGTGDTLRASQQKTEANFNELYGAAGIPEAPIDGNTYGRKNADWEVLSGGATVPTLQEVTTAGNTTTDNIKIKNDASQLEVTNTDETSSVVIGADASVQQVTPDGSVFQYVGQYIHTFSGFIFEINLYDLYIRLHQLTIKQDLLTTNRELQAPDKSGTIAVTDDIDLSGLVPYNSASADVDLGAYRLSASSLTTQTNGSTKAIELKSTNVNTLRTAEWQDKDYTGIADITDIPDVSTLLPKNTPITGGTYTKITYDDNGLVTGGDTATTAGVPDSYDKRYVTDAELVVLGNTSGTNSGDNATNSQYSGLAGRINQVFSISCSFSGTSPADGATYYLGPSSGLMAATESSRRWKFPYVTTIRTISLALGQTSAGSNETVSVYIRNSTAGTETLVGTFTSDFTAGTGAFFNFSGLSISIPNTTDYWTFKIVCPTWATNPTAWTGSFFVNAN